MEGADGKTNVNGLPPIAPSKGKSPAREIDQTQNFQLGVENGVEDSGQDIDKKLKQAITSRRYSLTYRLKKLAHSEQLEKTAKVLEAENMVKTLRIKNLEDHKSKLEAENVLLKQKIFVYNDYQILKEAEYQDLTRQMDELKIFYNYQHQQKKLGQQNLGFPYESA